MHRPLQTCMPMANPADNMHSEKSSCWNIQILLAISNNESAEEHRSSSLPESPSNSVNSPPRFSRGDFSSEVLLCFQISAAIKQHFSHIWKNRDNTAKRIGIWRKTGPNGLCVCFLPLNNSPKSRMKPCNILSLKCLQSCVRSSKLQPEINLISSNQKPEVAGRSVVLVSAEVLNKTTKFTKWINAKIFFLYNPLNPYGMFWHKQWLEVPHTFTLTAEGEFRQSWVCFIINCNSTALQTAKNLGDDDLKCGFKECLHTSVWAPRTGM